MGFLDKLNPRATRSSVIRCALIGATAAFVITLLLVIPQDDLGIWGRVFFLIFMTVGGAVAAAAIEWQLDDGIEFDDAEPTEDFDEETDSQS